MSAPDRRVAILVAALVLALAGVWIIGWAAAHQLAAPPVALVGAPTPGPDTGLRASAGPSAPQARMIVSHRPDPLPGFRPGPLFGTGPGSIGVRFEIPRIAAPDAVPRAAEPLRASPPIRLRVPSIGIDAGVGSVGLDPDRTMEVPAPGPLYDLPAWYRFSVTPGERGPSVIIGHVDSHVGGPSVFFDLARMQPGQTVEVDRADGSTARFEVTAVRSFPKDAFPTADVYSGTAGPELRLITCGGSFDYSTRSYRDNTVVFARLL